MFARDSTLLHRDYTVALCKVCLRAFVFVAAVRSGTYEHVSITGEGNDRGASGPCAFMVLVVGSE